MSQSNKYRPEFKIGPFVPLAIALIIFFFASAFLGIHAGLVVMVITFFGYSVFSLIAYVQTRNIAYLLAVFFQVFMGLYFLTVPKGLMPIGSEEKAYFFYLCGIIIGIWLVYLMVTQKGKWKGMSIFELVALNVTDTVNGYTERPRPAGKSSFSKSELFGFAEYIRKNLIAVPYIEKDCIVFVPVKMGDEHPFILGYAGDYHYYTWVSFDFEGNVSASIAKKDYLAYKEEFSYDQLCDSLGKLFIEFMEYYNKDEVERIMHRIRSVKVGLMS